MLFPFAGQRKVDYGDLVATNAYAHEGRSLTDEITSAALIGNTATVDFEWRRLFGGTYAISWQEADGATVVRSTMSHSAAPWPSSRHPMGSSSAWKAG